MDLDDLTTELFEELEAFNPKWRTVYPSVGSASAAADVLPLYQRWATTDAGQKYLSLTRGVPDHVGASRRAAEAENAHPSSLPFGLDNLGWLPRDAWKDLA